MNSEQISTIARRISSFTYKKLCLPKSFSVVFCLNIYVLAFRFWFFIAAHLTSSLYCMAIVFDVANIFYAIRQRICCSLLLFLNYRNIFVCAAVAAAIAAAAACQTNRRTMKERTYERNDWHLCDGNKFKMQHWIANVMKENACKQKQKQNEIAEIEREQKEQQRETCCHIYAHLS